MRRGRVNLPILLGGLGIGFAILLLLAVSFGRDPRALENVMEGRPAPLFELRDLEGKTWSLEALRGKVVVLNFWSTWCQPCKREHPELLASARAYPEVVFLGVVYQDSVGKVRGYLKQKGTAYPHLEDPDSRMAIDYGVAGVPETYFIDKKGIIRKKVAFAVNSTFLGEQLEPLLREGSS